MNKKELTAEVIKGKLTNLTDFNSMTSEASKMFCSEPSDSKLFKLFDPDDFNGEGGRVFWEGITSIDDDVAKNLGKSKFDCLTLNGLKVLSKNAAIGLAKFKGHTLVLNGLTELTEDVAAGLSTFKGKRLELGKIYLNGASGITKISRDAAVQVSNFKCDILVLDNLKQISADQLSGMANFQGKLFMKNLKTISKDMAKEFAKFKAESINLHDCSISKIAAIELSNYKGKLLWPNLFTKLDDETLIEFIRKNKDWLDKKSELRMFYRGIGGEAVIKRLAKSG